MRRKIIAGNWKMNLVKREALALFDAIGSGASSKENVQIMLFPPVLFLPGLAERANNAVVLGVQNFHPKESGAFTGEVSVLHIQEAGAHQVLIGHSERREHFQESAVFLKEKVDSAIRHGLGVVFCCGEPLKIREKGQEMSFVKAQLEDSLFHLDANDIKNCIIAYEPIWAIGTGVTASVDQAEEMHAAIRTWVGDKYGEGVANSLSILYGGSCNAANAKELFACKNVDGGLIGGAALDAPTFLTILNSF
jgi:triosephosphate isomerase (TIM)